jgi:dipeptidyl aminopeptidase/acylaminoacyl peptidase
VLTTRPQDPLQVLDVSGTGFGEGRQVPRSERVAWSELGVRARDIDGVLETLRFDEVPAGEIDALSLGSDGRAWVATEGPQPVLYRVQDGEAKATPLRQGRVRRLVPDPTGQRLAVVHVIQSSTGFEVVPTADRFTVTVLDAATQERVWTRPATDFRDLDWSADGTRLAVADEEGGAVLDAATGEIVYARRHAGLQVKAVAEPVREGGA